MDPLIVAVTGVIGLLFALAGWLLVKAWPALRKFAWFVDDVTGEPARPGVPARPGISERLAALEATQKELNGHMKSVRHHVQNDHKTNLRDDVDGIRDQLDKHLKESAGDRTKIAALYAAWGEGKPRKPRGLDTTGTLGGSDE